VQIVVALVVVQAALVVGYWLVERERSASRDSDSELGVADPSRVDGRVHRLTLTTHAGERFEWTAPERPTLLHFWATWCPPCRSELPGLLALPEQHGVDVVAVALDPQWGEVDRFFEGRAPAGVFLGDTHEIEADFGVHTLPVTLLVQPGGRIQLRFDGARDWTDARFTSAWMSAAGVE
jgi:thiol-disulfide isomerase/thioredoxin